MNDTVGPILPQESGIAGTINHFSFSYHVQFLSKYVHNPHQFYFKISDYSVAFSIVTLNFPTNC